MSRTSPGVRRKESLVDDNIAALTLFLREEGPHTRDQLLEKLQWPYSRLDETIEMGRLEGSIDGFGRGSPLSKGATFRHWYYRYVDPSEYD